MIERRVLLFGFLAACGSASQESAPAPVVMPPEAAGLVPGVSSEADVVAAWPGATVKRDKKFGGDGIVGYGGHEGVVIEGVGKRASLIELGGALRVVVLEVPIARTCAEVMPALAPRKKFGPCGNRVADPEELATCTRTADGKRPMEVSCFDGTRLTYRVSFERGRYGM